MLLIVTLVVGLIEVTPTSRSDGWRRLALVVAAVLVTDQVVKAIVVASIEPNGSRSCPSSISSTS